jgi:non-homologous end joining protein Ku
MVSSLQKNVSWQEVAKGIKLHAHDEYTIISSEELEKLRPEKSDTIDIIAFIDTATLDPLYFNNHYHVQSSKKMKKHFFSSMPCSPTKTVWQSANLLCGKKNIW